MGAAENAPPQRHPPESSSAPASIRAAEDFGRPAVLSRQCEFAIVQSSTRTFERPPPVVVFLCVP